MSFSDTATILQNLKGHRSDVTSCDFAPNFTLVTASSDKTVRLWDWTAGRGYVERSTSPLKGHKYGVTCVKVSPQGSMLATASIDGTSVLWNLHASTKIHVFTQVNGDAIRTCRFLPDSTALATGGDNGAICLWDLVHKSLIRTLLAHEGTAQSLSFTPDSQYMISGCTLEVINVWHVPDLLDTTTTSTVNYVATIDNAHDLGITSMDVSNIVRTDDDDPLTKYYTLATSGNSEKINVWTMTARCFPKGQCGKATSVALEKTAEYKGHSSAVTCVRYNGSGVYLVSASLDKLLKIWDESGTCICTLQGHTRYVNCASFARDSTIVASGSNDKSVIVWDLNGNLTVDSELVKVHHQLGSLINGRDAGNRAREDRLIESCESDETVQLIERIDDISDSAINSCCFYGNDLIVTGSSDKMVRLFRIYDNGNSLEELQISPIDSHTYSINYVEFASDGSMLASCSLDGCANIWNPMSGEKLKTVPEISQAVRVCRFSPDNARLITAGDDEIATVWDVATMDKLAVLEGHLDAITSAGFAPDGHLIATASHNGDFRLWRRDGTNVHVEDDAHDLGILGCDFSQNVDPIPNAVDNGQHYLLATCGNDSLVKLWKITVVRVEAEEDEAAAGDEIYIVGVKLWRTLVGHGGSIYSARFSPRTGEIVCSTATDRQARVWCVYSGECLHVLDHDSVALCCAFAENCTILAVGCMDKTLWLWRLPQRLVFQTSVATKIRVRNKAIVDWSVHDTINWLKDVNLTDVVPNATNANLNGQRLLTVDVERICSALDLDDEQTANLTREIRWLKRDQLPLNVTLKEDVPIDYLCPITQEVMLEPVTCDDGFTYERRAITEWFLSGKCTSPMTNAILESTDYVMNWNLRNEIHKFLYDDDAED